MFNYQRVSGAFIVTKLQLASNCMCHYMEFCRYVGSWWMDGRTAWLVPFQPQIPMGILDKASNMIHALLVSGCWKAVAGIVPATWNTELWTHGWRFSDVLGSLINLCNWQLWDPQRTLNTLNHQPLAMGSEFLNDTFFVSVAGYCV